MGLAPDVKTKCLGRIRQQNVENMTTHSAFLQHPKIEFRIKTILAPNMNNTKNTF